ncbi:hypothetical protein [Alkalicoccobacillus murimartini]|uniref:Uncharacterized protein n=1 Tax=Alkalicoccobacillus murimartini TaxID=171685 RepID=A0ABT9YLV9_9BACI|nr:hypothetical protein [Alkalicoccobacillus murimartini]MDQ0208864.1 hypothetical protein [Alkalicoccobacillus murimartini]
MNKDLMIATRIFSVILNNVLLRKGDLLRIFVKRIPNQKLIGAAFELKWVVK